MDIHASGRHEVILAAAEKIDARKAWNTARVLKRNVEGHNVIKEKAKKRLADATANLTHLAESFKAIDPSLLPFDDVIVKREVLDTIACFHRPVQGPTKEKLPQNIIDLSAMDVASDKEEEPEDKCASTPPGNAANDAAMDVVADKQAQLMHERTGTPSAAFNDGADAAQAAIASGNNDVSMADDDDADNRTAIKTPDGLHRFAGNDVNFGATLSTPAYHLASKRDTLIARQAALLKDLENMTFTLSDPSLDRSVESVTEILHVMDVVKENLSDTILQLAKVDGDLAEIAHTAALAAEAQRLKKRQGILTKLITSERMRLGMEENAELRVQVTSHETELSEIKDRLKIMTTKRTKKRTQLEKENTPKPSADNKYGRLSPTQKDKFEAKARVSVNVFLVDDDPSGINFSVRRAARDVQDFLPETGYKSRALALLVHANCFSNYQCRYHEHSKDHTKYDGNNVGKLTLHGVGHPPKLSGSTTTHVAAPPGFMNCGCYIEDVLLDFFWWKTWRIRSNNPAFNAVSETMSNTWLKPRLRAFVIQSFLVTSHLTLDDLYAFDYGTLEYQKRILLIQASRIFTKMVQKGVSVDDLRCLPALPFNIHEAATIPTADMIEPEDE